VFKVTIIKAFGEIQFDNLNLGTRIFHFDKRRAIHQRQQCARQRGIARRRALAPRRSPAVTRWRWCARHSDACRSRPRDKFAPDPPRERPLFPAEFQCPHQSQLSLAAARPNPLRLSQTGTLNPVSVTEIKNHCKKKLVVHRLPSTISPASVMLERERILLLRAFVTDFGDV